MELLVTTAIVVLLMVGVSAVFQAAGDATSSGQAVSAMTRDSRAVQTSLSSDLGGAALDGPWFFIRSQQVYAFMDDTDRLRDPDGNANTIDLLGTNTEQTIRATTYGPRSHRIDRLSFFTRGRFPRQTADDGQFVSQTEAGEALIRYQPMQMAGTDGVFRDPGDTNVANVDNRFASQWLLGRSAILLREDAGSLGENHFSRNLQDPPPAVGTNAYYPPAPLNTGAVSTGTPSWTILQNRYDVALTSIEGYREMLTRRATGGVYTGVGPPDPTTRDYGRILRWWSDKDRTVDSNLDAFPYAAKPVTSDGAARAHPIFARNVSKFIVEYAGDFLAQQNSPGTLLDGRIIDVGNYVIESGGTLTSEYVGTTDGVIDFVVDPATGRRSIRWYGLPRDTSGNGAIPTNVGGRGENDVMPLRDVIRTFAATATRAPHERSFANLTGMPAVTPANYSGTPGMTSGATYIVAWSGSNQLYGKIGDNVTIEEAAGPDRNLAGTPVTAPNRPSLIRVTIGFANLTNTPATEQLFEYIFRLP